jgi:hypothetical protein
MTRCLADFIGLTARATFIKGTSINRIPDPSPNSRGILVSPDALLVFQNRIVVYISEHQHEIEESDLKHLQWIHKIWVDLFEWEATRSHTNSDDQELLNTLHDTISGLEQWLRTKLPDQMYELLLREHVKMVVHCEPGPTGELGGKRSDSVEICGFSLSDYDAMRRYVDYIEDFSNWKDLAAKKLELARPAGEELNNCVRTGMNHDVEEKLQRQQHKQMWWRGLR